MPQKSDFLIDQENWLRLNCFLHARAGLAQGTPVDKVLEDARKMAGFVLGTPAQVEVVSISGEVCRFDPTNNLEKKEEI
jgi:hypothetical protein